MRQRGVRIRAFRRAAACTLGAILAVGVVASPAWAAAPQPPTNVLVTAGNDQIVVGFTPPIDNGGGTITEYNATCISSDGGPTGTGSDFGLGPPITVSGVTNANTYTCTVDAQNADGTSGESLPSVALVVGAPAPPPAPTVTRGDSQIAVAFTAPADNGSTIISYTATCTSSDGGAPGFLNASVPVSSITVTGLTNGKTYTCNVTATNGAGTGLASPDSATAFPATVPGQPPAPTIAKGNAQIVVTFGPPASDGGSAILQYFAACVSSDGGAAGTNVGFSPITVSTLTNTKTYTCNVAAINAVGPGSTSADSTPVVEGLPDATATPTIVAGNHLVVVTFGAPASNGGSPITSYLASCTSLDGGAPGTASGPASPINVTALDIGKTYTCNVTATNAIGSGPVSASSNSAVPAAVPDAPVAPTIVAHPGNIVVTFVTPADNGNPITGYTATCVSGDGGVPAAHNGPTSPITVTGVTNGKTYACHVVARSAIGPSPPSPNSTSVVPTTVPVSPTIGIPLSGNSTLTVPFIVRSDNGSPITNFTMTCASSDGGVSGSASGLGSPIAVAGLTNGHIYRCSVKAINAIGNSLASSPSRPVIVGQPGAPRIVSVVPGISLGTTGGFHVSFTPGPNNGSPITLFEVTCTPLANGKVGVNTGARSPIAVTGLTAGHPYTCSAIEANSRGSSVPSNAMHATVGVPLAPRVLEVLPLPRSLAMPFVAPAANGARIFDYRARCTSSDGGVPRSPVQAKSPIVASQVTPGATYVCLVTAINARGESAATRVGPVLAGAPPGSLPTCTGGAGSLRVSPGLTLSTLQSHTLTLDTTLGSCSGPYVSSARMSFTFHSKTAFTCQTALGVPNAGSGVLTWTAPAGLGTSATSLQLVLASTDLNTTTANFFGIVTQQGNLFTNFTVTGTMTLNQGIGSSDSGGDCSDLARLQKFSVTSISMTIS